MTKKQDDMFGIAASDEPETIAIIGQIMPAVGWRAVYGDLESTTGLNDRQESLACFALVDLVAPTAGPDQPPERVIRPMVAREDGEVHDVEDSSDADDNADFICLIPPHVLEINVPAYISEARRRARERIEDAE